MVTPSAHTVDDPHGMVAGRTSARPLLVASPNSIRKQGSFMAQFRFPKFILFLQFRFATLCGSALWIPEKASRLPPTVGHHLETDLGLPYKVAKSRAIGITSSDVDIIRSSILRRPL